MNAPDKIYLNIPKVLYENDEEIVATWDTQEWDDCVNPEYIRKGLLVEWMAQYEKRARTAIIPLLVKDFLEKLNSL